MNFAIGSTLEYLQTKLCIPSERIDQYKNKSITEIIEEEAKQGNAEAVALAADMFTNVDNLIELFQLSDVNNRFIILQEMDEDQLKELIPFLEVDDILASLYYFEKESVLDMLDHIPMEELLKVTFQMFSKEELFKYMPEDYMNNFLSRNDLDKSVVIENLKSIPEVFLSQMLESVTGEEVSQGDSESLAKQIADLNDNDYKQALKNLEPSQKRYLTYLITSADEKLFEKFEPKAFTSVMNIRREKSDIIESMDVIKPEYLWKMVEKLPEKLMEITLTQVQMGKFADNLITKCPDLLAKFVAS